MAKIAELKAYVIKLRKRKAEIEKQQFFCQDHKFLLEAELKKQQAELLQKIICEFEQEFDLGFVWDSSLD